MRIASLIFDNQVNVYRSLIPMEALTRRGHSVEVQSADDGGRNTARLLSCHAVFVAGGHAPKLQTLVKRLHGAGIAVLWDSDEDPGDGDGQRAAMARLADAVTVPGSVLAERYEALGGVDVRVIESYLSPTFARPRRVPAADVTIGWMASPGHRADCDALGLRTVFERLLEEHPRLQLRSIGISLGLAHSRYRHVAARPYERLPRALSAFDVGIAPLADVPQNAIRSNVKLKEYATLGLPWLASPVGGYAALGPGEGGELVPDDGWHAALERIVVDADHRQRLAASAKTWAQRQTILHHVQEWEELLRVAVKRARAARSAAPA